MGLLEIAKKNMRDMLNHNECEIEDFLLFADYIAKFEEIYHMESKPHLMMIHSNMWECFHNLTDDVMDYFGYEYVGRMDEDLKEDNTYIFECDDNVYDALYRLKDVKSADFTKVFKF